MREKLQKSLPKVQGKEPVIFLFFALVAHAGVWLWSLSSLLSLFYVVR